MPLMSKADYAARGILQADGSFKVVSKAYLSKASMKDRLEDAMTVDPMDGKLKIDSDKADAILRDAEDPARKMSHMRIAPPSGGISAIEPKIGSFEKVRKEREETKLEGAKLDLAERKGETLSKSDVTRAISASGQLIRDQLKTNSRRLAEKFSTMTDPREIRAVMEEENTALLKMISNDFLRRLPVISPGSGGETTH